MHRRAHLQAAACFGFFLLLTVAVSSLTGPDPVDPIGQSKAHLQRQLAHAAPGSPQAFKLQRKIQRLEDYRAGRPQAGFPDEYARILYEMKIPADRQTPEYRSGYQVRELKTAAARAKGVAATLPWVSRGPGNVAGRARGIVVDPDDPTGSTWFIASVGGGVWKTTDAGATWTNLTDALPNLGISCIAMAPSNHDVLYAGTGESFFNIDTMNGNGILKSVDRGQTWTQLASTVDDPRFNNISRIIVDPTDPDVVVASATTGIYKWFTQPTSSIFRSTDGGATWTEVYTENSVSSFGTPKRILQVIADPTNFNRQYASVDEKGILRSLDGGLTWAPASTGITDSTGRFELAISPVNSNYVFASAEGAAHSELWVSVDGGDNWFETFEQGGNEPNWLGGQGWYDNTIVCHPTDPATVYVGGVHRWRIRFPGGIGTTTRITSFLSAGPAHVDNHGLEIFNVNGSNFQILNTNDGGVGVTSNGESGWSAPIAGMTTTQFYGVDKRPGKSAYFGGMQDNGTWFSGENPSALTPWTFAIGGDGYETSWHFDDPMKMIGGFQFNGFQRSLDGGTSWSDATNGLTDTGSGNAPFISKIGKSQANPDVLYAVGAQGVWYSTDFGGNWNLASMPATGWGTLSSFHDVRVSEVNPDVVWAGARMDVDGSILVSTDGGLSFDATTNFTDVTMGRISGLATDPFDARTAYVLFSFAERPKILKTTDLGVTWTDITGFGTNATSSTGFPDVAVYDLVVFPNDPNRIWVGSEIGLLETLDGGASWALANNGLPNVGIWFLRVVEDEVVVATHGRGVWSVQIPELEQGKTFNPILEQVAQGPDGMLTITTNLRSQYDSAQILVDGSPVATFGPNGLRQIETVQVPITSDGTRSVQVVADKGGTPYASPVRTVDVYALAAPAFSYFSDFSGMPAFANDGFSITTPAGFSNPALHSAHFYPDGSTATALLTQPVIVAGNTMLRFDEIVIVEPGDPGTVFGDFAFWDYVIVEGSTDGIHWTPLEDGYDARRDPAWESAFNSSSSGTPSMFRQHVMDVSAVFPKGSAVLIRFRLYADGFVNGWGWAIDDIDISSTGGATDVPAGLRLALEPNYPNPFNPKTTISFTLDRPGPVTLRIYDPRGRVVRTLVRGDLEAGPRRVEWFGDDDRGARVASGVYFYRLEAGGQVLQRKMTLVK